MPSSWAPNTTTAPLRAGPTRSSRCGCWRIGDGAVGPDPGGLRIPAAFGRPASFPSLGWMIANAAASLTASSSVAVREAPRPRRCVRTKWAAARSARPLSRELCSRRGTVEGAEPSRHGHDERLGRAAVMAKAVFTGLLVAADEEDGPAHSGKTPWALFDEPKNALRGIAPSGLMRSDSAPSRQTGKAPPQFLAVLLARFVDLHIAQERDRSFANSRTRVSLNPGQCGGDGFRVPG